MIIQTAWNGRRTGLRTLTQDQHGKGQARSRERERAWLFGAMGFCLSSAQMYLELLFPPRGALLSTWPSLLSILSFEFYSPSLLHVCLTVAQFACLQAQLLSGNPIHGHSSHLVLVTVPSSDPSGHLVGVPWHVSSTLRTSLQRSLHKLFNHHIGRALCILPGLWLIDHSGRACGADGSRDVDSKEGSEHWLLCAIRSWLQTTPDSVPSLHCCISIKSQPLGEPPFFEAT